MIAPQRALLRCGRFSRREGASLFRKKQVPNAFVFRRRSPERWEYCLEVRKCEGKDDMMRKEYTVRFTGVGRLARVFIAVAFVVLAAFPAFALSDADHKAMLAASQEYRDADEGLNGAWKEAKKILEADEFKKLIAEQRAWVKKGRDDEAKALISSGLTKTQAYTEATMDRVLYINNVISRSVLVHSDKGYQGLYTFAGKGMTGELEVWWYDEDEPEHYVVFENSVVFGKDNVHFCSFTGKGELEGDTLVAVSDIDDAISVTIVFDGKKAVVSTDDAFKESGFCGQGVLLDGVYSR